jgi:hypothetical protein
VKKKKLEPEPPKEENPGDPSLLHVWQKLKEHDRRLYNLELAVVRIITNERWIIGILMVILGAIVGARILQI